MRVLVCGGRDYADREFVRRTLDEIHASFPITVLVHGGAHGADMLAEHWAIDRGVTVEPHRADWSRHGKAAGPIRNANMLASGIGLVVAFPGGRGTADMVRKAIAVGVETIVHTYPETR